MGYCSSCGSYIPDRQRLCSLCYGDPFYGRDGYYLDYLRQMYEEAAMEEELMSWEASSEEDIRNEDNE